MRKFAAVAFAAFVAGCTQPHHGVSLHSRVAIDGSFTPDEITAVMAGLDMWEDAVPEVHFTRGIVDRDTLFGAAYFPTQDTIYILRVNAESECTHVLSGGSASTLHGVICLDMPLIAWDGHGRFAKTVGHEVGHAFGLPHMSAPSIMVWHTAGMAESPTEQDVEALRALQ